MKTLKLSLLIAIILSISIGTLFAGGFALSGIGSRALSMGGAFRGMADDPTAMYWNPAGLGFMEYSSIGLAGAGIMPTADYTNSALNPLLPAAMNAPLPGFTFDTVKAENKVWMFPNLFAIKGGASSMKYGLGIYVPYGLGAEWDAYKSPTQMPTTTGMTDITWSAGFPEKEMMSSIGIVDIHPTAGFMITDQLSVGAGVSIYYGMISIKKIKPHASYSYYLPTTMDLEGTGMGFGGNIGALYKVNDNLTVGLSGKIPASIKIKGDAEIKAWLNDAINFGLHGNNPAYFTPYVASFDPDAEATLNLPGDIGIGWSYKIMPALKLNMDFTYTTWSSLDKVKIDLDSINVLGTPLEEVTMETKWNDTFRISMGSEYTWGSSDIRMGFFFDETPIPDSSQSPTWPDINDKISANLGYGYQFGPWLADLSFEHIFFGERKIDVADQTADNMPGTYNTAVNAFNVGLTYTFK